MIYMKPKSWQLIGDIVLRIQYGIERIQSWSQRSVPMGANKGRKRAMERKSGNRATQDGEEVDGPEMLAEDLGMPWVRRRARCRFWRSRSESGRVSRETGDFALGPNIRLWTRSVPVIIYEKEGNLLIIQFKDVRIPVCTILWGIREELHNVVEVILVIKPLIKAAPGILWGDRKTSLLISTSWRPSDTRWPCLQGQRNTRSAPVWSPPASESRPLVVVLSMDHHSQHVRYEDQSQSAGWPIVSRCQHQRSKPRYQIPNKR